MAKRKTEDEFMNPAIIHIRESNDMNFLELMSLQDIMWLLLRIQQGPRMEIHACESANAHLHTTH